MPSPKRVDLDDYYAKLPAVATQADAVAVAGYEAGEGFIKLLPYDRELPVPVLPQLIAARLAEFEATGVGW